MRALPLSKPHSTTASGTGTAPITEFLASPLPLSEKSRVDHVYSKCHSKCAIPLGARAAGRRVCEETHKQGQIARLATTCDGRPVPTPTRATSAERETESRPVVRRVRERSAKTHMGMPHLTLS